MISAVVPAQNEEKRIGIVIHQLLNLKIDKIIVVLNGSHDNTLREIQKFKDFRIEVIHFQKSLGIDIPRAVGAKYASALGTHHLLFIDGDLVGNIGYELSVLIESCINNQLDLALTNCYPTAPQPSYITKVILYFRQLLSQETGLFHSIGTATPSHGPHMVSRRILNSIPFEDFAVPPVEMVLALKKGFNIGIGVEIPHCRLGSSIKNVKHSQMIAQTIAGDCLEALCVYKETPRQRNYNGVDYIGYHDNRRWDLLDIFLANVNFPKR